MRPFSLCVALALAALLGFPNSHADEPETVKILVECAPDEVPRVKAALAGLPVKVYVAKRADADNGPGHRAEVAPRVPLRSAVPAMIALYTALSDVPHEELGEHFQIRKMEISQRRMSFTVIAGSTAALDRVRALVSAGEFAQAWTRPDGVTAGSVSRQDGRFKSTFSVALAPGDGPDSARRATMEPLSLDRIQASAREAGMRVRSIGREHRDGPREGVTQVTREVHFEETKLDSLLTWIQAIDSSQDLSVVAIRYEMRNEKEQVPPGQFVMHASAKVGYTFDSRPQEHANGAMDATD